MRLRQYHPHPRTIQHQRAWVFEERQPSVVRKAEDKLTNRVIRPDPEHTDGLTEAMRMSRAMGDAKIGHPTCIDGNGSNVSRRNEYEYNP